MPNWCNNYATLTGPKEKIDELIVELHKSDEIDTPYQILNLLRPRPTEQAENWYDWNVNNWGTKWDITLASYEIVDETTVTLSFDSAWAAPTALYEFLSQEGWDVDAFYDEPGMGFCGRFVDGTENSYEYANMSADEMEDFIPEEIEAMFSIVEQRRDDEENDFLDETEDLK
jgi:hypothetical protein